MSSLNKNQVFLSVLNNTRLGFSAIPGSNSGICGIGNKLVSLTKCNLVSRPTIRITSSIDWIFCKNVVLSARCGYNNKVILYYKDTHSTQILTHSHTSTNV